jgi:exodeoxyribonuclease VII small subunit
MTKQAKGKAGATAADDDLANVDFETALSELEALVERMEAGELSLEESLNAFERGVKLTRHCQSALTNAELKVKVLTEQNTLEDLDLDDLDDA